jgi:hypothetical protein
MCLRLRLRLVIWGLFLERAIVYTNMVLVVGAGAAEEGAARTSMITAIPTPLSLVLVAAASISIAAKLALLPLVL